MPIHSRWKYWELPINEISGVISIGKTDHSWLPPLGNSVVRLAGGHTLMHAVLATAASDRGAIWHPLFSAASRWAWGLREDLIINYSSKRTRPYHGKNHRYGQLP